MSFVLGWRRAHYRARPQRNGPMVIVSWDEERSTVPIILIIAGLAAALQAAPSSVTCSVKNDPGRRVYRLSNVPPGRVSGNRGAPNPAEAASHAEGAAGSHPEGEPGAEAGARGGQWRIAVRTGDDPAWIELMLPGADPSFTNSTASLSYTNANGGRHVVLNVQPGHAELEVWVDHGLEVNIDPDLDPRVDELTTQGVLRALECTFDRLER
jgi:hypothetical protein